MLFIIDLMIPHNGMNSIKIKINILRWFRHVQRMEENRIHKRALYMNLGTTRLRRRPRYRWQDEVREDGRSS